MYLKATLIVSAQWYLVSISSDKTLRVWDATSGECLRVLQGQPDLVCPVVFLRKRHEFVCGSYDQSVQILNTASEECVRVLKSNAGVVQSVAVLPVF